MISTKLYILLVPISSDLPNHNASIQLCVQKLRILIEDSARNLKYIGLLAMSTISHTHPKSIQSHSDLIMRCLDLLSRMAILFENDYVFIHDSNSTTVSELLYAAAWICSEFHSKKSKTDAKVIHDNDDDDINSTVKVTRDGELPENATESENKDNDNDVRVEKNKKYGPYRALNIDLNEKSIQSIPTPSPLTSQLKESVPKQVKIIEKQEQSSTSKSKHKRERSDDKELLSPADEEENRRTSSTPFPPPTTAEKTKVKKSSSEITTIVYTNTSVPLLLDIMTDDIHPTNQSE
ncbi:unnamed protein product [Rotaria sordida]|uniref:Clathrin/coatomer adaptor adaptin-like N-terminal domain-containing protein n=1 Tax=Rotaria sordida TaxID=392033 RepID=A0A815IN47_9BILA|nr:unnamed protein product [Rotaria sordida]CAF1610144.1 unnamed protein product [Rotaria sordida]